LFQSNTPRRGDIDRIAQGLKLVKIVFSGSGIISIVPDAVGISRKPDGCNKATGRKESILMSKSQYCTQNNGDCSSCNLTNYGPDCANNLINGKKPRQRRKETFEQFAISQGIHNGPATLAALHQLRKEHKGSRWITIIELFKARGEVDALKETL